MPVDLLALLSCLIDAFLLCSQHIFGKCIDFVLCPLCQVIVGPQLLAILVQQVLLKVRDILVDYRWPHYSSGIEGNTVA